MDCIFFINPNSGNKDGVKLAKALDSLSVHSPITSKQIVFTDKKRLKTQVLSLSATKDLIIICGGDGTINNIISLLTEFDSIPPIAIIPLGTGNDIARATGWLKSWQDFGIDGLHYALKKRLISNLDIWRLNISGVDYTRDFFFIAYAGFGYDGLICKEIPKIGPIFLKKGLYLVAGFKIFFKNIICGEKIKIVINGKVINFGQILFCNIDSYAGGSKLFKDSKYNDGIVELFFFENFFQFLRTVIKGRIRPNMTQLNCSKIKSFKFNILNRTFLQIDGEPIAFIKPQTQIKVEHFRVIPLLRPLKNNILLNEQPVIPEEENIIDASSVTPAIT